jgi:HEAT repeat protein
MQPGTISITELIQALNDTETPLAPRYLYRLSDLEGSELQQVQQAWKGMADWRRKALLEDLEELGEKNDLLSFEAIARLAVDDADAQVRICALRILWEFEGRDLVSIYTRLLEKDQEVEVRAEAAANLGKYVLAGELDELPARMLTDIVNRLLKVMQSPESPVVQQQTLESLGYSSRKEVAALIRKAYASSQADWKASALAAMGHSANETWSTQVIESLDNANPRVRLEAVRSAGELELKKSSDHLLELLDDPDDDVRQAAIWSLAQTGGSGVRMTLERLLDENEDDDEQSLLEDALELLTFTEETDNLLLLDLDEFEDDDEPDEDEETGEEQD